MCDLKENLWLCLECGNLGCGRSQFGGVGGNSHALAHADQKSHGVAVKLGSITPEGSADVYCYKCNEERVDPHLSAHLSRWGINLAEQEKTEKSLMEMQVEHNLKWDFSMTTQDGRELEPLFGPGFTGLKNLGNSCYLSSVMQSVFSLPAFNDRYFHPNEEPPASSKPGEDLETQLRKLADGILSGRYSKPYIRPSPDDSKETPQQKGIAPAMFKHVVGRGHEEFSTMRQQDAFEFLLHLFKTVSLSKHPNKQSNPVQSFRFGVEQRLQCISCNKVRYRVDEQDNISIPVPARKIQSSSPDAAAQFETVTLQECLENFTADEAVEFTCPACGSKDGFKKRGRFKTLPQNLVINARRFELVNWVPTKLNIPVQVDDEPVEFSSYMSHGPAEGEELLPEDTDQGFKANEQALELLLGMGFPTVRCEKALYTTGNSDAEAALNWLFEHMEDPDIDEPLRIGGAGGGKGSGTTTRQPQDPAKIAMLSDMGIEANRASVALAATDGDVNRALDWVFSHPEDDGGDADAGANEDGEGEGEGGVPGFDSFPAKYRLHSIVCHKGASVHAG